MGRALAMYKIARAKWKEMVMRGALSPQSIDILKKSKIMPTLSRYMKGMAKGLHRVNPETKIFTIANKKDLENLKKYLEEAYASYYPKQFSDLPAELIQKYYGPENRYEMAKAYVEGLFNSPVVGAMKGPISPGLIKTKPNIGHDIIVLPAADADPEILAGRKFTKFDIDFAKIHELVENIAESRKFPGTPTMTHASSKVLDIEKQKLLELFKLYPKEVSRSIKESPYLRKILQKRFKKEYPAAAIYRSPNIQEIAYTGPDESLFFLPKDLIESERTKLLRDLYRKNPELLKSTGVLNV